VMRFQVVREGRAVAGASLTSRLRLLEAEPIYAQAITDAAGTAELRVASREAALENADILVEAVHGGKSTWRKFRLRKST
jgi:hypothetical protein